MARRKILTRSGSARRVILCAAVCVMSCCLLPADQWARPGVPEPIVDKNMLTEGVYSLVLFRHSSVR